MIETYYQEVLRKRKAARIFWGIVFLFASILYFFFQGYYPAFHLSFRSLSESGSVSGESPDLIRSFGIINIAVDPSDATILLGSGSYGNDEKRMTNYGDYQTSIRKEGYLDANTYFEINRETPYYIELMTLVEIPRYRRMDAVIDTTIRVADDGWIIQNASGSILFDPGLLSGTLISRGVMQPIGESTFLSGETLYEYDVRNALWREVSGSGIIRFTRECPGIRATSEGLFCDEDDILLDGGKILTGVVSIGKGYVRTSEGVRISSDGRYIPYSSMSGSRDRIFLSGDILYSISGSIAYPDQKEESIVRLPFGDDELKKLEVVGDTWFLFGKNASGTTLTEYDPKDGKIIFTRSFPDISLEALRITERDGNIWIKTAGALLLIYHNDKHTHWIIDGEILAYTSSAALYREDGILWRADWSREDEE